MCANTVDYYMCASMLSYKLLHFVEVEGTRKKMQK